MMWPQVLDTDIPGASLMAGAHTLCPSCCCMAAAAALAAAAAATAAAAAGQGLGQEPRPGWR
jgi:hypothetical protein